MEISESIAYVISQLFSFGGLAQGGSEILPKISEIFIKKYYS